MNHKSYQQRKSPRLQGYDYSQSGAYFVTICSHNKAHFFGTIAVEDFHANRLGKIAYDELGKISQRWQSVDIDLFVVMPNHLHAIILIDDFDKPKKRIPTLGNIVGGYKAGVTRICRKMRDITSNQILWQERFHDHIIRDEKSLTTIRQYVATNPARWAEDKFYS